MRFKNILVVFGTRPEAIKLAPVIGELKRSRAFEVQVCVTGQHRHMLDQVLPIFDLVPDFDLDVMRGNQQLADVTATMLSGLAALFRRCKPDLVIVQGDTSTTLAASLAAFYERLPVAHVEAGLRTRRRYSPWPEELNRCLTSVLATWHFAPTESARQNLLAEGIDSESIVVTGNTVVDAVRQIIARLQRDPHLAAHFRDQFSFLDPSRRLILVTGHRRENFGEGLKRICTALRELGARRDVEILYPVHLNPNVRGPVGEILGHTANVHLVGPQEYISFTYLMQRSYMILTDSGGIQEEAPLLGKPVLLMRDSTERPEAVRAGSVRLVGSETETILAHANQLLDDPESYRAMAQPRNPFGDGHASGKIVEHLQSLCEVEVAVD